MGMGEPYTHVYLSDPTGVHHLTLGPGKGFCLGRQTKTFAVAMQVMRSECHEPDENDSCYRIYTYDPKERRFEEGAASVKQPSFCAERSWF